MIKFNCVKKSDIEYGGYELLLTRRKENWPFHVHVNGVVICNSTRE